MPKFIGQTEAITRFAKKVWGIKLNTKSKRDGPARPIGPKRPRGMP